MKSSASLLSLARKHRHLLLALCWIAAVAVAYSLSLSVLCGTAVGLLLLGAILLAVGRLWRLHCTVLLLPFLLCAALLLGYAHRSPTATLATYEGKQGYGTLSILDVESRENGTLVAKAALSSLGSDALSATVKLTLRNGEAYSEGDVLRVYVSSIDSPSSQEVTNGIHAVITATGGEKTGEKHTLFSLAAHYNASLSTLLQTRIDGDEGAFLSALLLGDKSGGSPSVSRDMARIGTSHILALSGLHVSLFISGLAFLLRWVHKKWRILLLLLLMMGYVVLTGASPSVLRAGFMCLCTQLAFLSGRSQNSIFSLFASLSIILALEPYCVFSLSLWLSALATLGILLYYAKREEEKEAPEQKKKPKKLLLRILLFLRNYTLLSAVITAAATVITLPLLARTFGSFSLLSVPANLLLAPLSNLLLYGGIAVLLFGFISPLALLVERLTALFLWASSLLASIPHTQISFSRPISLVLACIFPTLIFLYYLFVPKRRFKRKRVFTLLLALFISLSAIHIGDSYLHRNGVRLDFASDASSELDAVCLREATKTFLVDGALFSADSAAFALSLAKSAARQEIDGYVITEYGTGTAAVLSSLSEQAVIRQFYLPEPKTPTEALAAREVLEEIRDGALSVIFYGEGEALSLGRASFSLLFRIKEEGAHTALCYSLQMGLDSALCASASCFASGGAFRALSARLEGSSALFVGSYGQKAALFSLSSLPLGKAQVACAAERLLSEGESASTRARFSFFAPALPLLDKRN